MSKVKQMLEARCVNSNIDKSELIRQVRSKIEEAVMAIFEENPTVNIIAVEGYAPNFNDGDPCKWGVNTQVDWFGEVYHNELHNEMSSIKMTAYDEGEVDANDLANTQYAKLLSRKPPGWKNAKTTVGYEALHEASILLCSFSNEFEIWDNDANGTSWMFVRKPSTIGGGVSFETVTDTFEHD